MMYIKLDADQQMTYFCKNCGEEQTVDVQSSLCVLEREYGDNRASAYRPYINKYLKFDPTLPRVSNIKCPNTACAKPEQQSNDVIVVRYDETHMRYLYHCSYCDSFWKT
jgi:hypothetical protein